MRRVSLSDRGIIRKAGGLEPLLDILDKMDVQPKDFTINEDEAKIIILSLGDKKEDNIELHDFSERYVRTSEKYEERSRIEKDHTEKDPSEETEDEKVEEKLPEKREGKKNIALETLLLSLEDASEKSAGEVLYWLGQVADNTQLRDDENKDDLSSAIKKACRFARSIEEEESRKITYELSRLGGDTKIANSLEDETREELLNLTKEQINLYGTILRSRTIPQNNSLEFLGSTQKIILNLGERGELAPPLIQYLRILDGMIRKKEINEETLVKELQRAEEAVKTLKERGAYCINSSRARQRMVKILLRRHEETHEEELLKKSAELCDEAYLGFLEEGEQKGNEIIENRRLALNIEQRVERKNCENITKISEILSEIKTEGGEKRLGKEKYKTLLERAAEDTAKCIGDTHDEKERREISKIGARIEQELSKFHKGGEEEKKALERLDAYSPFEQQPECYKRLTSKHRKEIQENVERGEGMNNSRTILRVIFGKIISGNYMGSKIIREEHLIRGVSDELIGDAKRMVRSLAKEGILRSKGKRGSSAYSGIVGQTEIMTNYLDEGIETENIQRSLERVERKMGDRNK